MCSVSTSIENHIAIKIFINAEEFEEKNYKKLKETDNYIKSFDNEVPIFDKRFS